MLRYCNHRFTCEGVSFRIPDGYYLETELAMVADNYLHLLAPDSSYIVEIRVNKECSSPSDELTSVMEDMRATVLRSIDALEIGGLTGCHATYRMTKSQYYEMWLEIASGVEMCVVVISPDDILRIDVEAIIAAIDPKRDAQ